MRAKRALTGQKFGRWTIIGEAPMRGKITYWNCVCQCGGTGSIQGSALVGGKSLSCGCLQREQAREKAITHGMTKHPAYRSWTGIHQRCGNPKDTGFPHYGGRGIKVCERWRVFENFWADMGPTWAPKLTIERNDSNGDYEPANCCWVAKSEQPKNRRTVIYLDTPWGRMTKVGAAEKLGMSAAAFGRRYNLGWRGDRLFSPPVDKGARITPRGPWDAQHAGRKLDGSRRR